MHFEGVFETDSPGAEVYALVTDPRQVAGCMPELQKLEVRSADEFDAVVKVGVSFIRGDLSLHCKTAEKVPQTGVKMIIHGSGLGSGVDMEVSVKITEAGKASMRWEADATVSGKIASLGQRLMESQAEKIIKQFFECFRKKLERA